MTALRLLMLAACAALPLVATAQTPAPMLVDVAWLSQHLNDRNLVILHVDNEAEYKAGHIPGARFVTMQQVSKGPGADSPLILELLPSVDLRSRLQALGISDDSRIVVYYGRNAFPSATRIVLTLDHAGLGAQTSLLNGGLTAWTRAGNAVTPDVPSVTPGKLTARPMKQVTVEAPFVQALPRPAHTLVDGRAPALYQGVTADGWNNVGHIAGAVNIPFTEILDSNLMVDRTRLEGLFSKAGVKPGDTVVAYCHIGQQGTTVVFAARLLGHQAVLYDGSMQDWGTNKRGAVIK